MALDNQINDPKVLELYYPKQEIGRGAYGSVWECTDNESGAVIAIKKIIDAFQNALDAQRTFREIVLLRACAHHENVVSLLDVIPANNSRDMYLVCEYLPTDLHTVIRANMLEDIHQRYIIYQLLKVLMYIHSCDILHRDIKPSNILMDSACKIKLCDFGLARKLGAMAEPTEKQNKQGKIMTDYVATRWYRAPEVLVGSSHYTMAVDMWSVGCILGELLNSKPMFRGNSTGDQLDKILQWNGIPSEDDIATLHSEYAMRMIKSRKKPVRKYAEQVFPGSPPDAVDILKKLLAFNSEKRLAAGDALQHGYISEFLNTEPQPVCEQEITMALPEDKRCTPDKYREVLASMYEKKRRKRHSSSRHSKDLLKTTAQSSDDDSLSPVHSPTTLDAQKREKRKSRRKKRHKSSKSGSKDKGSSKSVRQERRKSSSSYGKSGLKKTQSDELKKKTIHRGEDDDQDVSEGQSLDQGTEEE